MASTIRGDDNFDSAGVGKNATAGGVGTYAYLYTGSTGVTFGGTYSGSSLHPAGVTTSNTISADNGATAYSLRASATVSGTWRSMGYSNYNPTQTRSRWTLFVRIS